MSDGSANVNSFTDSEAYGAIYFYTYFLVMSVLVFVAYQYSSKIQLDYQSYEFLKSIETSNHIDNECIERQIRSIHDT